MSWLRGRFLSEPEEIGLTASETDAGESAEGVALDSVTTDQWAVIHEAAHDSAFGERSKKTPTPAQCEAGNYKLGRARVQGFHVAIETPKGAYRRGVDKGGRAWETQMPAHYGYLSGTTGADGDAVDCFIGPWPDMQGIYVVNQWLDGRFDEHKVMFGFIDEAQARSTYLASYSPGWQGLRDIVPVTPQQLRTWLRTGNTQKPLTSGDLPSERTSMDRVMWCGVDPIGKGLAQVLYGIRAADADEGLLLDSLTDADLDAEFEPGDVSFDSVTLDAITIESRRIEATAKALMRALKAQSGAVMPMDFAVSKPRMLQGVLNVTVLYKLSDGQTLTIFFNNPDATPRRLKPEDVLVSWKWLLNRKDVTIVVAPERGRDLNLNTVALRVMALAEKNSAAFTVALSAAAAKDAVIADLKGQIKAKQDEFNDIERQIATIKAGGMLLTAAPERIELTGGELGEFADTPDGVRALRDAALDRLESMRNDWVPCSALQALVQIRKSAADKIVSLSHDPRKLKAVAKIREIIAAAKKVKETAPYAPAQEQNVRAYFLMRSEIVLNGEPLAVRLVFKQDDKGKFHWDHTIHAADTTFDSAQEKGPSLDGPDPMATSNGGGVAGEPVKPTHIGDSHQPEEDGATLDSGGQGDLVLNLFIEGDEPEPAGEPVAELTDRYVLNGRSFAVLARFTGPDATAEANRFMEANPNASLLAELPDGTAVIADSRDAGDLLAAPEPAVIAEPLDEPDAAASDAVTRAEETAKILIGRGWLESQAAGDPMTKDSNGQGYSLWLKDSADPDSFYALIETQGAFQAEVGGGPDRSPTEIADLIDAAINNSGAVPAPEPTPEPAPVEPVIQGASPSDEAEVPAPEAIEPEIDPVLPVDPTPAPNPERDAAKQFLLDAKAGALDFNDPAMTEKLEAAYTPFADDQEIAELFNDAVNAFVDFETARSATIA